MGYNELIPSSNTMITIMFLITLSLLIVPFSFPEADVFGSNNYRCDLNSNVNSSFERIINEDFRSTLSATASEIINKTASSGGYFYTYRIHNREKTYGLALCSDDISDDKCTACVHAATITLLYKCGYSYTSGIIFEPLCVFKYRDVEFEKEVDTLNGFYTWTSVLNHTGLWVNYVSAEITRNLMTSIIETAIGNSRFYASGKSKLINETSFDFVYGMVMCNRGLPDGGCKKCLDIAFASDTLSDGILTNQNGFLGLGSCMVRYSTVDFFN